MHELLRTFRGICVQGYIVLMECHRVIELREEAIHLLILFSASVEPLKMTGLVLATSRRIEIPEDRVVFIVNCA